MVKRIFYFIALLAITAFMASACGGLKVNIGTESRKEPLKEFTLKGQDRGKVLLIQARGFISDTPRKGFLADRASMVEEVVSQLRKAEKDKEVRAVVLEINSPGGSVTASDILYHEIVGFKERTGTKIVASLMDVAASGGYYIALPSDSILAHPTTITGSVGVIFMVPKVAGLMDKLGIAMEVNKSGKDKDLASPFRPSTGDERIILQELTDRMGKRFIDLVAKHRTEDAKVLADISTARIYLAAEALQLKLIDRIGYVDDAISEAKNLAGLTRDAKVVVFRRSKYPDDNVYNTSSSWHGSGNASLVNLGLPEVLPDLSPGFYYLWTPGTASD
jgi:protease IV